MTVFSGSFSFSWWNPQEKRKSQMVEGKDSQSGEMLHFPFAITSFIRALMDTMEKLISVPSSI